MRRRMTAAVMAVMLSVGLLSGCGGTGQSAPAQETETDEKTAAEDSSVSDTGSGTEAEPDTQESLYGDANGKDGEDAAAGDTSGSDDEDGTLWGAGKSGKDDTGSADNSGTGSTETAGSAGTNEYADAQTEPGEIPIGDSLEGAEYVMIYDPLIYDEYDPSQMILVTSLETGDISSQIETGMLRADDMEMLDMPVMISQDQLNKGVDLGEADRDGDKGMGMDPIYSKGDTHEFNCYASDLSMNNRAAETFECVYEGETCYIWSLNNSCTEQQAQELGKEFDENIYQKDVDTFGPARFTGDGGKVNILMYPMQERMGGFFCLVDLFSEGELSPDQEAMYKPNYDHAIINVNSDMMSRDMPFVKSTLAHEFQHLICASEYFYYNETPMMRTWLNESMSAYAEEMIYPGIKDNGGYNLAVYMSDAFRTGQSLYNFDTTNDEYIGAYGIVYLFSQYMDQTAGNDIFSKIHEYWRTTFEPGINEAKAIAASVPEEFYQQIDQSYDYPQAVSRSFINPEDEWMSKLTLNFQMELLSGKLAHLEEYEDVLRSYTLYSEINPQTIEGGGRMLVKTANGNFKIPDTADPGLIYIGLDENYQPIPDLMIVGR